MKSLGQIGKRGRRQRVSLGSERRLSADSACAHGKGIGQSFEQISMPRMGGVPRGMKIVAALQALGFLLSLPGPPLATLALARALTCRACGPIFESEGRKGRKGGDEKIYAGQPGGLVDAKKSCIRAGSLRPLTTCSIILIKIGAKHLPF